MKFKRIISLVLTAVMILGYSTLIISKADAAELPFTDVKAKAWYFPYVSKVYESGIMLGKSDTKFEPNTSVTRAEITAILARLSGDDITGKGQKLDFKDTKKTAWYADYVGWAVETGLVTGYDDGTFKPNKAILRQEIATMFVRYFTYAGVIFPEGALVESFSDASSFKKWAVPYIDQFRQTGLVEGDSAGKFNPESNTKRCEVATMLVRFTEKSVKDPMFAAVDGLTSLRCKNHGYIHYTVAETETASPREDISLSKMGAVIRRYLGLDDETYEVIVTPDSYDKFNEMTYETMYIYDSKISNYNVKIRNRITGAETETKRLFMAVRFDMSEDVDSFAVCVSEDTDELMTYVWENIDDFYVLNKDGKIHVPTNIYSTKKDFSEHMVKVLFSLLNNRSFGFFPTNTSYHEVVISDEDFAQLKNDGEYTVKLKLRNKTLGIETDEKTFTIVVMGVSASKAYMNGIIDELDTYLRDLALLLGDCERAGIPTPYEELAFSVIEKFAHEILVDYIEAGVYERTAYFERSLEKIYLEAKADLEAYLAGEKAPMDVPQYVTSDLEVDGFTIYANTVDSKGNVEKRPVYFYGYGDGTDTSVADITDMESYGSNTFHYYEVMINEVVRPANENDTENVSADGKYVVDIAGILSDLEAVKLTAETNQAASLMLVRGDPWALHDAYPDIYNEECTRLNYDHPKTREIIEAYLRAVVPLFAQNGSVNNIVLTNEPAYNTVEYGDFYVPMWVEFLKERYGNDLTALNEAHRADYKDWSDAPLVGREGLKKRDVLSYDNQMFNSKVHAGWHGWIADVIRELAPDIPIHTKLKTIEYDRPMQQYGIRVEDFAEYMDLGGCDDVRDDVIYYDHIAYAGEAPVVDSEVHIYQDFCDWDFSDQMETYVDRVIWRGFMHHLGMGNLFAWDFWPENGNQSLSASDVTTRPTAMYNIGKVTMDANRLSKEIDAIVSEEADVAILYSYASRQFTYGRCTDTMSNMYYASLFSGEKVRIVSEEQIEKINKCKILLIPECDNVTAETLAAIAEFQKNGGYVLIVGDSSLTKDDRDLPHDTAVVDAIKKNAKTVTVKADVESYRTLLCDLYKEQDIQRVWIVDAVTGEPIGGETEWLSAEYDGKTVVTAYATNTTKDLQVKLIVDGKAVTSSTELRSGDVYGEVFTLRQDESILLSVGESDLGEKVKIDTAHKSENGYTYAVLADGTAEIIGYNGAESAAVPEKLGGKTVSSVGAFAFDGSGVKKITLPATVTDIADYAFYNCDSLAEVSLGNAVKLGERVFYDCDSLETVVMPDSVTSVGGFAFAECDSLTEVSFSDNITSIGKFAFYNCKALASLDLPESLVYLGPQAFRNCSGIKGTVDIPYGVTEIRYYTFSNCSGIENLIIPNSVVTLGEKAFQYCTGIKDLELPNSLTSIKGHALTGITAPIEFKHGLMFTGSLRVESDMYLPATVATVGEYVTMAGGKILCEAGSFIESYCIENGKEYEIVSREAHVHTPGKAATCTSHQICTECNAVVMPAFGHDYRVTAGKDGKATLVCSHCKATAEYEK